MRAFGRANGIVTWTWSPAAQGDVLAHPHRSPWTMVTGAHRPGGVVVARLNVSILLWASVCDASLAAINRLRFTDASDLVGAGADRRRTRA